ncbi:hypothetical protein BJ944DRAFT_270649 [Cunninghamella echinulata]|nr:hypothetical protein BJ944DRAFT_270649 [Cunninghamella echinulata]
MNILGLSKKAKKRFSSYKNDRGMRRCKSTGNIYSNAQVANSDSSISSNESDNEDKMKITQKIKDLKVADNSKEPSVENNKKKALLSDPKPQSILNTATSTTATTTTTTTTITSPTKPNNYTSSKNPGITISTEEEKVTPKVSSCPTSPIINNNNNMKLLSATTTPNIQQDDLDALLSLEAQERMDAQLNRGQNEINNKPLRPTTLKFALPEPPVRTISRSKSPIVYPRARPYRSRSAESVDRSSQQLQQRRHVSPSRKKANKRHSRWSRLMGSDSDESDSDSDDANIIKLQIGTKVNLFKRPLPTVGYIRYIGPVDNEIGQWIGVELDHRVGNCDGSIKGKSYFKTGPQRGIFLKEADIEPIH